MKYKTIRRKEKEYEEFKKIFIIMIIVFMLFVFGITTLLIYHKYKKVYYANDFNIETLKSQTDYDNDGIDMKIKKFVEI